MTNAELLSHRLANQQLLGSRFQRPREVVAWLGAMQAQEYAMARWAIGLRLPPIADAAIEQAFDAGEILRTHLLRPTWHFVTPADIRWLLALTAPRVHGVNGTQYRKFEFTAAIGRRSNDAIAKALEGGKHLTRATLQVALQRAKIPADGMRLAYLLMHAELDGVICSGPRVGRQFTYALLDERVPRAPSLTREEALAELSRRYFASRGPATAHDFAAWSGLTVADAKAGIATLRPGFAHELREGRTYIFPETGMPSIACDAATFLMPDYDEYGMSYQDRSALLDPDLHPRESADGAPGPYTYNRMIVIEGRIAGTWHRTEKNDAVVVEAVLFQRASAVRRRALVAAVNRFGAFVGRTPRLHLRTEP